MQNMVPKVYQIHVWSKKGKWHKPNGKDRQFCHALAKYPLATTHIFVFNIAISNNNFEDINNKLL